MYYLPNDLWLNFYSCTFSTVGFCSAGTWDDCVALYSRSCECGTVVRITTKAPLYGNGACTLEQATVFAAATKVFYGKNKKKRKGVVHGLFLYSVVVSDLFRLSSVLNYNHDTEEKRKMKVFYVCCA